MPPKSKYNLPLNFLLFFYVFLFLFFSLFVRGMPPNGDPVNYYIVAESIVEHGTTGMEIHRSVPLEKGRDDRYYSKFGIGQSLLEIPFYALARTMAPPDDGHGYRRSFLYLVSVISVPAISALSCIFFLLLLCAAGFDKKTSLITTIVFSFGTMVWAYSKLGFSEPLQCCMIVSGIYFALRGQVDKTSKYSALCAAAMGVLILTKISMIVVVPFLLIYLLLSKCPGGGTIKNRGIPFVLVFSVFIAIALVYNYYRFGSILNFGYFSGKDASFGFSTPLLSGLYGLLFSPGKSVFIYVPVILLSLAAGPVFHRENRQLSILCWSSCVVVILFYAKWWAWHGDYAWGPRFMVPLLPLAMIPSAVFFRDFKYKNLTVKLLATIVIVASICVQMLAVSVSFYEYMTVVRHQVPRNAFFMPGRQDLRDDQLLLHFVPEFSPIAGQWWILKYTLKDEFGDDDKDIIESMQKDFPWKGIMSYTAPTDLSRAIGFDTWWNYFSKYFPSAKKWTGTVLLFMLSGIMLSLFGAVATWRKLQI